MEKKRIKKLPYLEQFRHLKKYLILAGIKLKPAQVYTVLYVLTAVVDLSFLFYFIYKILQYETSALGFIVIVSFLMLTLGYVLIFLIMWLMFLLMVDYLKFKRKLALEEILPEFLRLVSANHRAGLPLEMSIWKANRPRFGILSEEINEIARNTFGSGDLIEPLKKFGTKYDSPLLRRVISNLVEGLKTGANIAGLLDDVATNITTIKNTRKELASEVENYMLFITVTVLMISPLMFGLSHKMSGLIETVKDTLAETGGDSPQIGEFQLQVEAADGTGREFEYYFDIFVYLMIGTNSVVSVLLMSMVKYGNVKQDIKKIPVYYVTGIIMYVVCKSIFASFLQI